MEKTGQLKKKTLSRKFLGSLVMLALVICLCTGIIVTLLYYDSQMKEYSKTAFSLGKMASDYIDGDRIKDYVTTMQTDEYYDKVQFFMDTLKKRSGAWYYYVFVHNGDDLIYVWDAYSDEEKNVLGDHEAYMERARGAVEELLTSPNPREDFIVAWHPEFGLIGTARVPIYDSTGKGVAVVGVDLNMPNVVRMMLLFLMGVIGVVLVVTVLGAVLFYSKINRNVLQPIKTLEKAADDLVTNIDQDVPFNVDIHTGDELESLASSFEQMDIGLRKYIHELSAVTAEKERIGAELNVATQIQADMLPRIFPAFPARKDFDIFASMDPAKEVGGDFYDFFLVDDDHLALVMADVSGKGVPAALFMVIAKTLIKNRVMAGDSPEEALSHVNEQLCEGNEAQLFVTVWLAIIELSTGRGVAANAGHEHPAIRRAGGIYELDIYKHSPAVAVMEGMRFRQHEFRLEPGDSLFVYTDGVTEATDSHDELFGTDRMISALNSNPAASPAELLSIVRESINRFVGEAPQFDDITMLNLQYYGPSATAKEVEQ